MQFRLTYTIRDLEVCDTPIRLEAGAHRDVSLKISNSSGSGKKATQRLTCRCEAQVDHKVSDKNLAVFDKIEQNSYLKPSERDNAELQYIGPDGERIFLPSINAFPPHFSDFLRKVRMELHETIRNSIQVIRWRLNRRGCHSPFSVVGMYWSRDGAFWHSCPTSLACRIEALDSPLAISPSDISGLESMIADGHAEPVYHELHREAAEQSGKNLRSAFLLAFSALEVGMKHFISRLEPGASWLAMNSPSPPMVKLITEYIPTLKSKAHGHGLVERLPDSINDDIKKAVTWRNDLAHKGVFNLSEDKLIELLSTIKDLLWYFDYHSGHEWARSYCRLKKFTPES
jgi:hypothetical protein